MATLREADENIANDLKEESDESSADASEILKKLDITEVLPDREIGEDNVSHVSSLSSSDAADCRPLIKGTISGDTRDAVRHTTAVSTAAKLDTSRGNATNDAVVTDTKSDVEAAENTGKEATKDKKRVKNPFTFLKKLSTSKESNEKRKKMEALMEVKVESLPQKFITKYLGHKPCTGLWGIKHTRQPVEDLVTDISQLQTGEDLPLLNMHISTDGILISEHKSNQSTAVPFETGLLPMEFISYGVQDIKYTRIFAFIVVRELSARTKKLECHCYICDSSLTSRKLALSMSLAFQEYAKSLEGKPFKFQVDLRPPSEVEQDLMAEKEEEEEECEA